MSCHWACGCKPFEDGPSLSLDTVSRCRVRVSTYLTDCVLLNFELCLQAKLDSTGASKWFAEPQQPCGPVARASVPRWHDAAGTPGVRYSLLRPYG